MFSGHETLKKSVVQLKNTIIGMLRDSGLRLSADQHKRLFHPIHGMDALEQLHLFTADYQVIHALLSTLHTLIEEKKALAKQIIHYGAFLQQEVELLISIKGVSPLLALGFLADVGDIYRFPSIRRLNAYLRLVPVTRSSGKRDFQGHIMRCSRHLTRTLFSQAVQHIGASSPHIVTWYKKVRGRRGVGISRIALIRKTVKFMRRMLIEREQYQWMDTQSYQTKLCNYYRILNHKDIAVKISA